MYLSDLHIDGTPGLLQVILDKIKDIEVDICIFGGDYRMAIYGSIQPTLRSLQQIVRQVQASEGIFGILGNHDCIEMIPDLEEIGITVLVNDAWSIERQGQRIWLAGIDDPVVDSLVDSVIYATSQEELTAACKALDRVLWYGYYVVPNWYLSSHRLAYSPKFKQPKTLPLYYSPNQLLMTWWDGTAR